MKYLKYTLCVTLLFMIGVACEVQSDEFPVDFEKMLEAENTGAFARVAEQEGATWNLFDIANQEYTLTLEVDDATNGGQLESISFSVGYRDNAAQNVRDLDQVDLRSFQASDFSPADNNLPSITTSFTSQELMDALGLNENQLGINAAFTLRWELTTTTGKVFNSNNSGGNVTGGAFFRSPYAQNIGLSLEIPADQFVGTYNMTQDGQVAAGSGVIGAFGNGYMTGQPTISVELSVDPDNELNGRVFDANYFTAGNFLTFPMALTIDPITNSNFTTMSTSIGSGFTCGGGISLGPVDDVSLQGSWDSADDSEFTLAIVDDITNDCGNGSPIMNFTFTKQ